MRRSLLPIVLMIFMLFSLGSCSDKFSNKNRISSLRLFSEDGKESGISDIEGEKKLLMFFPDDSGYKSEAAYKLTEIFGDTVHVIAVFKEQIPDEMKEVFADDKTDWYYCNSKSIFKEEVQIFLTDKDGKILGTFGSSFAGAAAEMASDCDKEELRRKITGFLISENEESFSGDSLLIEYMAYCLNFAVILLCVF